jgi:hypothetical protein
MAMTSTATAMSFLQERHGGFSYGYRMRCDCGDTSHLSAADYYTQSQVDALMPCDHCDRIIHFGPAVAGLRDEHDPALDNARIGELAWYHTSASRDWPAADYAGQQKARLLAVADRFHYDVREVFERQTEQALHVGTYEAAIENMLRRIRDQDDAATRIYLHRIWPAVDPGRVNDGYRDENHEPAAQLTVTELRDDDLDAVRYLNTHESVGSLSPAVLPETTAGVQTMASYLADPDRARLRDAIGDHAPNARTLEVTEV